MKAFVAAGCVLLMAGCSSVLMKDPFPDSTLTEQEQAQLTGNWQIGTQAVSLSFSSNDVPWLAFVEWENDDFQLKKYRLHFTKRGDALYLSMPAEPNGATNGYYFAEIKVGGQLIMVWSPSVDAFEMLIRDGSLKGSVEKNKIDLDTPAAEILELISTNAAVFDYKNPLVFQRLD